MLNGEKPASVINEFVGQNDNELVGQNGVTACPPPV